VNEKEGNAHLVSRGERGKRFVPITVAVLSLIIVVGIYWFWGGNIITFVICGILLWFGWSSLKTGLFGSQELIDEMCLDSKLPLSRQAEEKWKEVNKVK